jgi:hypothetical protein
VANGISNTIPLSVRNQRQYFGNRQRAGDDEDAGDAAGPALMTALVSTTKAERQGQAGAVERDRDPFSTAQVSFR